MTPPNTTPTTENSELRPRWREHELILVTLFVIFAIAGNAWEMLKMSSAALQSNYGDAFIRNKLSFSYFLNVWLTETGLATLLYLSYLVMNFFILPRILQTNATVRGSFNVRFGQMGGIELKGDSGQVLKHTLIAIVCAVLLCLGLGFCWGIAAFYRYQYDYLSYSNQEIFGMGLKNAFFFVFSYLSYASIRELVLKNISKDGAWLNFRIRFMNQLTSWLIIYLSVFFFLQSFDIMDMRAAGMFFLCVLPAFVITALINLYWLFPLQEGKKLFSAPFPRLLLASAFCIVFPFSVAGTIIVHDEVAIFWAFFLMGILLQLVITFPVSWIIYRFTRQKILRFKGLELELDQSKADLQFLRSQINPHFLFNSLNTLYGTALQENAHRSAEGIQKLGDMMRFMLHENNQEMIPMYKELEYLTNYIDLQKLRTQSSQSISIESDIQPDHCHHRIAPMLLIPFVENAFKHGISLRERSWINIHLQCNAKGILFEVRNSVHNHKEPDPEKEKSGIGMKNVVNRLRLLYPDKHEFFVNGNEKEFFIQLQIQLAD